MGSSPAMSEWLPPVLPRPTVLLLLPTVPEPTVRLRLPNNCANAGLQAGSASRPAHPPMNSALRFTLAPPGLPHGRGGSHHGSIHLIVRDGRKGRPTGEN